LKTRTVNEAKNNSATKIRTKYWPTPPAKTNLSLAMPAPKFHHNYSNAPQFQHFIVLKIT